MNNNINIYFYDNFSSSFNRFGNPISRNIIKENKNVNIIYIHDNYDRGQIELGNDLETNVLIVNSGKVLDVINTYPPDLFICFGQPTRIPDAYWTLYFNIISVPTYRVQHGLYIENYERDYSFFLKEIPRVVSYLKYLYKIIKICNFKINSARVLISSQVKFLNRTDSQQVDQRLGSNHVFVWGKYWENWFRNFPFYSNETNFYTCGSFDFKLLNDDTKLIKDNEDSVTYICQTLVEDGRLKLEYLNKFLNQLKKFAETIDGTLYLKLHPRSNESYYKSLSKLKNVEITTKFPISNLYISHYSTILTISALLKKEILLVKFPKHDIPKEFQHMTKNVISFDSPIEMEKLENNTGTDTEYYYSYVKDPHLFIAKKLLASLTMKVAQT